MTNQEVGEIKGHFDKVAQGLRGEIAQATGQLRGGIAESAQGLKGEIAESARSLREEIADVRRYTGVVAEDLRSQIGAVAEGVALASQRIDDVDLRVDALTSEVRRGFAGVRAEIHRLHETDDELRRRIEAREQHGR